MIISTFKEVGPPNTPQEIKRFRRQVMDACRKLGQPVVFRHIWTAEDEAKNLAKRCPACWDSIYEQVRGDCAVCYGFGYASKEFAINPNLWINNDGQIVETTTPQTGWVRAPRYGGFAQSVLTWLIEPDVAVDIFRISELGTMVRTYEATGVAPWLPHLADNDLCINVVLSHSDYKIVSEEDRFQLKMVQPMTVRGFGRQGRLFGAGPSQEFRVGQTFQMAKVPTNNILYEVPRDVE
ncbi:MAG: hypothetical protein QXU32_01670 [Nitrososphaerales archaeon]